MKKKANIVIAGIICSCVIAGNVEASEQESILFRKINWLTCEEEVEEQLNSDKKMHPSWIFGKEEEARIDSWYHEWQYMYTDLNVEGAGTILQYDDANVAGYTAELECSFMYPILDGSVIRDTEKSLFYKAQYVISDMEDIESVYNDIVEKLTSLYGKSKEKSYYNMIYDKYSPNGQLWEAEDGSLVWAGIYYNSYNEKYDECRIVYAAPNTDEMLQNLSNHLAQETVDKEAADREANAGNTEGL